MEKLCRLLPEAWEYVAEERITASTVVERMISLRKLYPAEVTPPPAPATKLLPSTATGHHMAIVVVDETQDLLCEEIECYEDSPSSSAQSSSV